MSHLVRITILIRKRDDITFEEFDQYWANEHPKTWLSIPIVREKIVKYSQFHVDNAFRVQMGANLPLASYDGAAEMWAKSLDDLMAVFTDEEYLKTVVPDEQKILKRDEAVMMLGSELPKWVEGREV